LSRNLKKIIGAKLKEIIGAKLKQIGAKLLPGQIEELAVLGEVAGPEETRLVVHDEQLRGSKPRRLSEK
jgi:hypothetical protein